LSAEDIFVLTSDFEIIYKGSSCSSPSLKKRAVSIDDNSLDQDQDALDPTLIYPLLLPAPDGVVSTQSPGIETPARGGLRIRCWIPYERPQINSQNACERASGGSKGQDDEKDPPHKCPVCRAPVADPPV